ncbi:hypothetical protein ACS0TY_028355 [Phlomoides rotata]
MQLGQLIQNTFSRDSNASIQPFNLDVLSEAFHLRESASIDLSPAEKGIPTVAVKSKSGSKSKDKHKKHKDKDREKDKEHKKRKHRSKEEKEKKRDKNDKKKKREGDGDTNGNKRHKKSKVLRTYAKLVLFHNDVLLYYIYV